MAAASQDLSSKESLKLKSQNPQTTVSSHDDSVLSMSSFSFGEGIGINWRMFNELQLSRDKGKSSPKRVPCVQQPSSTPLQTWFVKKCKFFAKDRTRTHHDSTRTNNFEKDGIDEVNQVPQPDQDVEVETLYLSFAYETETAVMANCESLYKTAACLFENGINCTQEKLEAGLNENTEKIQCCVIGENEQMHESTGFDDIWKSAKTSYTETSRHDEKNFDTEPNEINIEYQMVYPDYTRRYVITPMPKRFGLRL